MLSDAFEEAFYQLDQDRDGVITIKDLERYAESKNLKETFKKKWLSLFADEKNVIYYDNFCATLGIVPAMEKFQYNIHKVDMTEETQMSIIEIIANSQLNDKTLSSSTLKSIEEQVAKANGGLWDIKLNPHPNDINVKYAEDGILYYSINAPKKLSILIWRVPQDLENGFQHNIHKVDMTEETQKSIVDIIANSQLNDEVLPSATLESIEEQVAKANGGLWNIKLNPQPNDVNVKYAEDGILYYSPNASKNLSILIWKVPQDLENGESEAVIYECDMSESVKIDVLKSVSANISAVKQNNINPLKQNDINTEPIRAELNEKLGETWNIALNPTKKELKVDYDFDGKIYFSPDSKEDMKMLIWRKDIDKKRGSLCCCCGF